MSRADEIRARLDKATPGPWRAERQQVSSAVLNSRDVRTADDRAHGHRRIQSDLEPRYACFVEPLGLQIYGRGWEAGKDDLPSSTFTSPDAELIAYAPEDLAWALGEIGRLRAMLGTILDNVDYMAGRCRMVEPIAAVLPREIIAMARDALKEAPDA